MSDHYKADDLLAVKIALAIFFILALLYTALVEWGILDKWVLGT